MHQRRAAVDDVRSGAGPLPTRAGWPRQLRRRYSFGGKERSFLSASCAAPDGFDIAFFPFARGGFRFADGTEIDTTLERDCRVR